MQLSELLQWLSLGQKTGTLVIRGEPGEKRLFFKDGRIVSSSSTIEREYLGNFLISYGFITDEELTRAMEVQRESKILLGKILVIIGAIREEELTELIRLKAAETIYDIFLWTEGAFEFMDRELPQQPMVPISVEVTGIVLEGLRRFDDWQRIRTRIRSMKAIPAIIAPVDVQSLPDRERLLLGAIDGLRSVQEIARHTHNPDFHAARFVWELVEAGRAEVVGFEPESEDRPPSLSPEPPEEMVFAEAADTAWPAVPLPGDAFSACASATPPPTAPTVTIPDLHFPGEAPPTAIAPTSVPTLTKPLEDLMSYSFTPNEAFILSRINGLWDVKSIARISPFPEPEVFRLFQKLDGGGVISWR